MLAEVVLTAPEAPSRPITLIGMPGSGKSAVGRLLARRLGREWLDCDALLEQRLGTSIKAFFTSHGEAAFRDLESEVLREVLGTPSQFSAQAQHGVVVSTGGGMVLREANREMLHAQSFVVYLRIALPLLWKRLATDTERPLLQASDPQARLRELFQARTPLYESIAHLRVDTGRGQVQNLVNKLAAQVELNQLNS